MKILSIVGARPNFIKLGPLSKEIRKEHEEIIVHTGQHYDHEMSKLLFEDLAIPEPDYNLGINQGTTLEQVSRMSTEMSKLLLELKPDLTIAYGDTSSTVAGAMASIYCKIPCAHVEAGPRNKSIAIYEMLNRLIVDRICSLLFCATRFNLQTLESEGLGGHSYFVGDQMYDAYLQNKELAMKHRSKLKELGLQEGGYHIATCHRAETTDVKERLSTVVNSFIKSEKPILFPIHPRTEKMLKRFGLYDAVENSDNIVVSKPLGYLDFLMYGTLADKVITDSGGVQREGFFMGKPCIVIYDESAWPEIERARWMTVTGLDEANITEAINNFQLPKEEKPDIFGKGDASKKTLEIIENFDLTNWDKYDGFAHQ